MLKDPRIASRLSRSGAPDYGEKSYLGSGRLDGAVAIVTEGDSGVGRAVAIAFAREGADVVIAHLGEREGADESAQWVHRANRRAIAIEGDVRDPRFHEALVERTMTELGRVDILVNNSAFQSAHTPVADESNASTVEELLRTQTESVFFLAKAAAARMKPGGSIINTNSLHHSSAPAYVRAYAATENAVVNLTASLANQFAKDGIRVNAVAPGPVWTRRVLATLSDDEIANFGSDTLFGRPAHPAEIAPAYVFLASSDASYITGAVLPVMGGRS